MLRLRGVGAVLTAVASATRRPGAHPSRTALPHRVVVVATTRTTTAPAPLMTSPAALLCARRQLRLPSAATCFGVTHRSSMTMATTATTSPFLRGVRLATAAPLSPHALQYRWMRVKGQSAAEQEAQRRSSSETTAAAGEEGGEQQADANGAAEGQQRTSKQKKSKAKKEQKSFMDHVRGLREDYKNCPHIYNTANAINFIVFTVFCLCSTGSNTEERWWMEQWGVDNHTRPWTWLLHSFLTNNFLAMTFAMMLLHTMCHQVLPTLGSRGLLLYCGGTAVISGAVMWLGNVLYYGSSAAAPEKQYGPWDMIASLFVMEYFYYGLTPMTILNSFSGWIRYACWVGEVCILYFDWQPTLVGTLVGLALCKGVPRFKAVKPPSGAA
ncbi:hypothetical protein NESM_000382100 [Novymonas esmeraldas]|uniref:Uncharacterized protein n=1 Tax=Novymonas esmeraldas TaxID=1808958 RepID=A0AAW0ELV3_9TRYP